MSAELGEAIVFVLSYLLVLIGMFKMAIQTKRK